MRVIGLIALGFFIGLLAGAWALKALSAGGEFGRGVMALKAHHSGQLRDQLLANRCDAQTLSPHLEALVVAARDLEPAFPSLAEDTFFRQYAAQMRERIGAATVALGDCARLREAAGAITDSCKACHRDYKG